MLKDRILEYYEREISTIKALDFDAVEEAVEAIKAAYEREATIYIFGNGGSAATASHFICDFNKGISEPLDKKFNLICLNDNTPIVMAIANDISYDDVFYFQLGMTGYSGGKLKGLSDYNMHVAVDDMQITEDVHMSFDHMMYRVLTDVLKK